MQDTEERKRGMFDVVDKVLSEHEVKDYTKDEEFKCFKFTVDDDKKHLDVDVRAWGDRIEVMCFYPFRAQSNALALVSLYMAMSNNETFVYTLKLNQFNGKLLVETDIPYCREPELDRDTIWREISSAIQFAFEHYMRLSNYAVGKLPAKEKEKYTWLLLSSFDAINGDDINYSNVWYGCEDFKEDFFWKMQTIQSFSKWIEKTKQWYDDNFPFC